MSLPSPLDLHLYGTLQPVNALQPVSLADLSFLAQATQVRRLCIDGREVLRSIGLVIRDGFWGTHSLIQASCETGSHAQGWWQQAAGAVMTDGSGPALDWSVSMDICADRLLIKAELAAQADFTTCRAGLMLLHPLVGVTGAPESLVLGVGLRVGMGGLAHIFRSNDFKNPIREPITLISA